MIASEGNIGVICVSETWLDSTVTDTEIEIPNYAVVRKDRNRQGGGVCVFIRSNINFMIHEYGDQGDLEVILVDIL